jgi:hypothetical protein
MKQKAYARAGVDIDGRAGKLDAKKLCKNGVAIYLNAVTTVKEIEAAIPRLSRAEVEELRAWIENFLEDQLELTDEVKAKLDQSRREIAEGNYTTRQPE